MTAPDVFDHADFRLFLDAWYQARKARNPRFSYRAVAKKLGSTDPSAFLNVVRGRRRLAAERVEALVGLVGLAGERAEYFRLLVRHGQARDPDERERAWAAVSELRARLRKPEIDAARFQYVSDRIFPTIGTLAECAGFVADPGWVARTVRPPIDEARAAEALVLLERLGFLIRDGDRLVPAESTVRTAERVEELGSIGYHRQTHALAGELLDRLWDAGSGAAETSAFLGITVAVPEGRLGDLRRLLWELQPKVLHEVEGWSEPRQRVCHVAIQLLPASERVD